MFPAALAIVVGAFPIEERGKAMASSSASPAALTAVGPLAGGYLTEWTWRAIFWVNIPVAIIALMLTAKAKPDERERPAPIDYRGTVLIAAGMGLRCSACSRRATGAGGARRRSAALSSAWRCSPSSSATSCAPSTRWSRMRIFRTARFAMQNVVVFLLMIFRAALLLRQHLRPDIARHSASDAGLFLLVFFGGFASPRSGEAGSSTRRRAPAVIPGCVIAAIGFFLWAARSPTSSSATSGTASSMAGAGVGLVLGPASTDAINRAPERPTARSPGSPRRFATSARASAWRCSARS